MQKNQRYILLPVLISFMAFPATAAYMLYFFTKNPSLRPLGISKENLASAEHQTASVSILVQVDWGRDQEVGPAKADLRKLISDTLSIRTDDFTFKFNKVPGEKTEITFIVGPNHYGPFPPSRMIDGINSAFVALEMTKKTKRLRSTR